MRAKRGKADATDTDTHTIHTQHRHTTQTHNTHTQHRGNAIDRQTHTQTQHRRTTYTHNTAGMQPFPLLQKRISSTNYYQLNTSRCIPAASEEN